MRSLTWTDANGAATVLDGSAGIIALANPVGLTAPNPVNTVDDFVNFDGGVLVNRSRPVRKVALGLYLEDDTRVDTIVSQVATMLQGPGTLTWTDINTRTLRQVVYEGGLDGSGDGNLLQRALVVSLVALDPWWYGPAASQILSTSAVSTFDAAISFDSVTPFDGGGTVAVPVSGDAEAYPVFTVTGPATTLTVGSGGYAWSIASALVSSTDVLVVDHRPSSRGPRKNGGPVDWSLLTESSRLWPLAQGLTAVITGATGTSGSTSVVMSYEPRFLTP